MRVKRPSIRLIATLAIFITILFVSSTVATAQEQVLHSFTNNGTDGIVPDGDVIFDGARSFFYDPTAEDDQLDLSNFSR